MKEKIHFLYFIIFLFLGHITITYAQESFRSETNTKWVEASLGIGLAPYERFALGLSYSFESDRLYQIAYDVSSKPLGSEAVMGISAGLAKRMWQSPFLGIVSLGPAFVFGQEIISPELYKHETKWFYTAGTVAKVTGVIILNDIGLGLGLFTITSLAHSVLGLRISFVIHNNCLINPCRRTL